MVDEAAEASETKIKVKARDATTAPDHILKPTQVFIFI